MTREAQVLFLAIGLLAAWPATADAAVTVSTGLVITSINNGSTTVNFAPVANAHALVSLSAGSVNFAEGGIFTLSAHYTNGSSAQIFTTTFPGPPALGTTFNLNTPPDSPFPVGNIDGLIFQVAANASLGFGTLPANTIFTFNTLSASVPEPASWALMLTGF